MEIPVRGSRMFRPQQRLPQRCYFWSEEAAKRASSSEITGDNLSISWTPTQECFGDGTIQYDTERRHHTSDTERYPHTPCSFHHLKIKNSDFTPSFRWFSNFAAKQLLLKSLAPRFPQFSLFHLFFNDFLKCILQICISPCISPPIVFSLFISSIMHWSIHSTKFHAFNIFLLSILNL